MISFLQAEITTVIIEVFVHYFNYL